MIETKHLRVGLIGAGRIVERAHLPILSGMPGILVVGLFDPEFERAQLLARRFGVPQVCRSLEELLNLDLDITLVACPNHLHAEMSVAALNTQSHVLCEKPMATSAHYAEMMIKAAEVAGRELMIGFNNRFRPEVMALKQAIEEGYLGEIKAIRCGWSRYNGVPGTSSWYTNRVKAGGGALIDLGSHLVDLALWLVGKRRLLNLQCVLDRTMEQSAQATWYMSTEAPTPINCDVDASASAFAIFSGHLNMFIEVSWACNLPHDRTYIHVIGDRGAAKLDTLFGFSPNGHRPERPLRLWTDGKLVTQEVVGASDLLEPYQKQWEYFFDCLRSGRSLGPSLAEGLAVVQLIEAMYKSAEKLEASDEL